MGRLWNRNHLTSGRTGPVSWTKQQRQPQSSSSKCRISGNGVVAFVLILLLLAYVTMNAVWQGIKNSSNSSSSNYDVNYYYNQWGMGRSGGSATSRSSNHRPIVAQQSFPQRQEGLSFDAQKNAASTTNTLAVHSNAGMATAADDDDRIQWNHTVVLTERPKKPIVVAYAISLIKASEIVVVWTIRECDYLDVLRRTTNLCVPCWFQSVYLYISHISCFGYCYSFPYVLAMRNDC